MYFYIKKVFLLLMLINVTGIFSTTVKTLLPYEQEVISNELLQKINSLLERYRDDNERKTMMNYIFDPNAPIISVHYTDEPFLKEIREKIQQIGFLSFEQAAEFGALSLRCLNSLPARGFDYKLRNILACLKLSYQKVTDK